VKAWRIVQQIYEQGEVEPTLTHVFYGETRERAQQVYDAHMGTDAFMRGCVTQHRFRDFACRAESYTERYDPADDEWVTVR
jgi:hypothetical protein